MYIDVGTIVNQEVYKQISQYTTCVICEGLAWNPVQCESCENCFCEECLVKWQKESKQQSVSAVLSAAPCVCLSL